MCTFTVEFEIFNHHLTPSHPGLWLITTKRMTHNITQLAASLSAFIQYIVVARVQDPISKHLCNFCGDISNALNSNETVIESYRLVRESPNDTELSFMMVLCHKIYIN